MELGSDKLVEREMSAFIDCEHDEILPTERQAVADGPVIHLWRCFDCGCVVPRVVICGSGTGFFLFDWPGH